MKCPRTKFTQATRRENISLSSNFQSFVEILFMKQHDGPEEEEKVHAKLWVHVEEKWVGLDYGAELFLVKQMVMGAITSRGCRQGTEKVASFAPWFLPCTRKLHQNSNWARGMSGALLACSLTRWFMSDCRSDAGSRWSWRGQPSRVSASIRNKVFAQGFGS